MPAMMSKLPSCIGIRSIGNEWSLRLSLQSLRMESTVMDLPLAISTVNDFGSLIRSHISNFSNSTDTKHLSAPVSNHTEA